MPNPTQAYTPPGLPIFPPVKTFEDARTAISKLQNFLQQYQTFNTTFFQQYLYGDSAQNTIFYRPVLSGDGVAGTFTYNVQQAYLMTEGVRTTIAFFINWSAISGSPTGIIQISTPLSCVNLGASNNAPWGGVLFSHAGVTYTAGYTYLATQINQNTSQINIIENGSGVNGAYLPISALGASGQIQGQITYRTG